MPTFIRSALLMALLACAWGATTPVKIIFDTDMDSDCDDAGFLAMLHALADRGEAEILGAMMCADWQSSAYATDVINHYYGRGDIPIGVWNPASTNTGTGYSRALQQEFPHDLGPYHQLPRATVLYRKLLAAEADGSVVVVTVGTKHNLRDLLLTGPDESSPLDGKALVAKKVKRWVAMGGTYPSGRESNFYKGPDAPAATRYAVDNWPTPMLFSGWEIGSRIDTGARLVETSADNPVRRAYEVYFGAEGRDRASWDQTALLVAVRGTGSYYNVVDAGHVHIFDDGSNEWRSSPDKNQAYLTKEASDSTIEDVIEGLMIAAPALGPDPVDPPPSGGDGDGASGVDAHWRFDETGGSSIIDSLGSHHGTLVAGDGARVDGVSGRALAFGPTGRWVDLPTDAAFSSTAISIAVWLRLDQAAAGWRAVLEHDRRGSNWYGLFIRQDSTRPHFRWGPDSSQQVLEAASGLQLGTWHHVAATFDPVTGRAAIYIDGALSAATTGPASIPSGSTPLRIGANLVGSEAFPGLIDEARLLGSVLSADEVAALASGGDISEPPVVADPGGTTIYEAEDASLQGPSVDSTHAGFTGSGYADYRSASGDRIAWNVDIASSGRHRLAFRYALGAGDRPLRILVDGAVVADALSFPATGTWTAWDSVELTLQLSAGTHQIVAEAIGASGGNLDHLAITPEASPTAVAINMQPGSVPVPAGWLADSGAVFADRGNGWAYGWNAATAETRDRNASSDQVRDTLNHLQKPSNPEARWEIVLPDGSYQVDLLCGDPSYTDQVNDLLVEGRLVADPDGQDHFDAASVVVEVRDGRLTIGSAASASNAKLCAVTITPVPAADG